MLKSWMHDVSLAVQARSGLSTAFGVWAGIVALAAVSTFVFLCVAGYDWLALQFGGVYAGLVMAGMFLLIALVGAAICVQARRRARERAILERTARAHAPSWLADPRILATAVQIGRELGWERIVPVALFGFVAAQWAREYRRRHSQTDR
ncbi:MAG TPA: hypothetical protein VMJ52_17815 [Xanthobacteraceae bacterium]|nr:hypothetical protein [Xanthobacteraceae bacterium]